MDKYEILFAGFGGQGILFSGKFLAYYALSANKNVSWLPSYGPEMRGGTANCSVIISEQPVGTPIITTPTILVAMNLPSYDKFESTIVQGGMAFVDSSLILRDPTREDITTYRVPATRIASDAGIDSLANMVIVGNLMKVTGLVDMSSAEELLNKLVPPRKANLIELNLKALRLGYDYEA